MQSRLATTEPASIASSTASHGKGELLTRLSFWRGSYDGYGWSGDGRPPLFCSQGCGVSFGVACWHAGMRIKATPSISLTPTTNPQPKDNRNAEDSVV
jgi:hypothetical protein